MQRLRIAFIVSLGVLALGLLGFLAVIAVLSLEHPAGSAQLATPPVPLIVAAIIFVIGGVGYAASGIAISARLRELQGRAVSEYGTPSGYRDMRAVWRFIRSGSVE